MKGILYRIIGFLALAFWMPAIVCHAQEAHSKEPKRSWLPAKKFTLADPAIKAPKVKLNLALYQPRFHISTRSAEPAYTGGMECLAWGWFCHAEHRFRQTTKVPLYVRLGSVQQTNWLEGK